MDAETGFGLDAASRQGLELGDLLALFAELAATDAGRRAVLALAPTADADELDRRRGALEEAGLLLVDGRLVPAFEEPLVPVLERLGSAHRDPLPTDLLHVRDLLRATGEARGRIRERAEASPRLASRAGELVDLAPLVRSVDRVLDRRGRVRDDASPQLVTLRRRVLSVRDDLYRQLQGSVESHRDHLAEETIPLHDGRLVLLLRSGAKGRLPGLVHGRSATGKSFYFEPLDAVEGNNRLVDALGEERGERERLLAELLVETRDRLPEIEEHLRFLAELDLLQAATDFGERAGARLIPVGEEPGLRLLGARHPLLDPRLAELRERALGTAGHRGDVVPLDLELDEARPVLVITGPNAGGKTVALKCAGLIALAGHCGLPVPAARGSRLPLLSGIVASVGDDQDLLADRSTFSGRLERLGEAWTSAAPGRLVLVDELGSGTDPEEGAALSVALLERLAAGGGLAVLTTHLTRVAAAALETDGAVCAAMEFDPASGSPTYRLLPGAPGASEALALARRLGLPAAWIGRAEELLDPEHRELQRLLHEVEQIRLDLAKRALEMDENISQLQMKRSKVEYLTRELESERRRVAGKLRARLEAFEEEVRGRLHEEVETLRRQVEAGRRRGLAAAAARRALAGPPEELAESEGPAGRSPGPGDRVRHAGLGWEGTLESVDGDRAEVSVRGKRLRCQVGELRRLDGEATAASAPARRRPAPQGAEAPVELRLIGRRVEPALDELDRYLDQALLSAREEVRVVHGHGTGALREAVREHLRGHPAVASFRPGEPGEGGDGATVVALREG
jgi:DNA mismatch repair protein MutS2